MHFAICSFSTSYFSNASYCSLSFKYKSTVKVLGTRLSTQASSRSFFSSLRCKLSTNPVLKKARKTVIRLPSDFICLHRINISSSIQIPIENQNTPSALVTTCISSFSTCEVYITFSSLYSWKIGRMKFSRSKFGTPLTRTRSRYNLFAVGRPKLLTYSTYDIIRS